MSEPEPEFNSVEEADAAYYGDSGDGSGSGGGSGSWGELQEKPTEWAAGWLLGYQEDQESDRRRWFTIRFPDEQTAQAVTSSGTVKEEPTTRGVLDRLPSHGSEQDARSAYQAWVEQSGQQQESDAWGEWQKIQQAGPWWIWAREHKNEDRTQFLVAGTNSEGTEIYLQPDGTVDTTPHLYEDPAAVQAALDAFQKRMKNGAVPEEHQPTGASPGRSAVSRDAARAGGGGRPGGPGGPVGGLVDAVGGPRNALLLGGVVAGGAYYLDKEGYVDIPVLGGDAA